VEGDLLSPVPFLDIVDEGYRSVLLLLDGRAT
jgi:hypothetical protein